MQQLRGRCERIHGPLSLVCITMIDWVLFGSLASQVNSSISCRSAWLGRHIDVSSGSPVSGEQLLLASHASAACRS